MRNTVGQDMLLSPKVIKRMSNPTTNTPSEPAELVELVKARVGRSALGLEEAPVERVEEDRAFGQCLRSGHRAGWWRRRRRQRRPLGCGRWGRQSLRGCASFGRGLERTDRFQNQHTQLI